MKKRLHYLQVGCSGEYCKGPACKSAFSRRWWKILLYLLSTYYLSLCWGKLQSRTIGRSAWKAPDFGEALNWRISSLKQLCQWCSSYIHQWKRNSVWYKVGCTSDSQRQHSLLGHMDEEEVALSASRLLRGVLQRSCLQIRLQSTLVKNTTYYLLTTCLCAGENFKAGRLAGALERHQTLGEALNWRISSLKQLCQWCSSYIHQWKRNSVSGTRSEVQVTASDSAVF